MIPHALTVTMLAQQRCDELLAEADHDRLVRRAEDDRRMHDPRWPDRRAAAILLVAIALLFAAGAAA